MIIVIVGLSALAAIAVGFALTLRRIADLRALVIERSLAGAELAAGLHKLTRDQMVEGILQGRITRSYLVEILEKRLLPHVGYQEKPKTPVERWMLDTWQEEVTDRASPDAPQQNQ